jgi:putative YhbY family RNA-binding protein
MPAISLTPTERKACRALAHHLAPVVMIGGEGLTSAVRREADVALSAHGLIKIRALAGERNAREALLQQLADQLNAAPVQHIGRQLVLWRPLAPKEKIIPQARKPGPKTVKVLKHSARGGQLPEVKHVRVLGNQRLTASGKLKKARLRQQSVKKSRANQ